MKVIHLTQNIPTNLHLLLRLFFGRHENRNCKAWIWAQIKCGRVAQTTNKRQKSRIRLQFPFHYSVDRRALTTDHSLTHQGHIVP